MPCVVPDGFRSVQAEMTCDSSPLDFYGCTAMACKLWSESAQGRPQGRSRSTIRWRTSWLERAPRIASAKQIPRRASRLPGRFSKSVLALNSSICPPPRSCGIAGVNRQHGTGDSRDGNRDDIVATGYGELARNCKANAAAAAGDDDIRHQHAPVSLPR